jgi:hypothetical protein
MKSLRQNSTLTLSIILSLTAAAWSQCNNPASPGVVICTPTTGSTVVYVPEISVRSTPAPGASIAGFSIYDGNTLLFKSSPGQAGDDIYDGSLYNGIHDIVVTAKDTAGNVYQAKTTFTVTGQGYPPCAIPTSPGINFCEPQPGNVYSTDVPVGAAAKGQSAIKSIAFYLEGTLEVSNQNSPTLATAFLVAQQGVPYTVTVDATDASGNKYSVSKTVEADYTYGYSTCQYFGCTAGVTAVAPGNEVYVGNSFYIDMQIVDNPEPITEMKAYIDSTLVATSSTATLEQQVTGAPNGTHILTVEGWDTEGAEYFIQQNLNINVSD